MDSPNDVELLEQFKKLLLEQLLVKNKIVIRK